MDNKRVKNSGITVLEVVVSLFVITIGLVGVISLVLQNIQAQYINKNVLIASGLAQEGLELVRNKRDLNWLTPGNDWKRGAGAESQSDIVWDGEYKTDYTGAIWDVDSIDDARLYIQTDIQTGGNYYGHAPTDAGTSFYRLINISDQGNYLDVKCKIRWLENGQPHDFVAETYLYNWR